MARPLRSLTLSAADAIAACHRCLWTATIGAVLLVLTGCSANQQPRTPATVAGREFTSSVLLHGKPLELHVSAPRMPAAPDVVLVYASGDGGWFGAAVDMFRQIADAGYAVVGFSSRSFLKIERPRGALVSAAQLADEYRCHHRAGARRAQAARREPRGAGRVVSRCRLLGAGRV